MSHLNRQYNIVPGLPAPASDNLFRAIEAGMIKLDAFFATATLDGLGAAFSDDEWLAWVSGVGDECVQELLELGYKVVPPEGRGQLVEPPPIGDVEWSVSVDGRLQEPWDMD